MKSLNSAVCACLLAIVTGLILIAPVASAQVSINSDNELSSVDKDKLVTKVAPGELLPISVNLSSLSGDKNIDVLAKYSILNGAGNEIYSTSDTVAVDSTASFVKYIQVPFNTKPGIYTAKTVIVYQGQLTPATTQFSFTVEPKIIGIFRSDFFLYGSIATLVGILLVLLAYFLTRYFHVTRFIPFDYRNIPREKRIFYEILSDMIMQMRGHVGDEALIIAASIEGLKINKKTGRVIKFTESPSKVIANLVSEYEKQLGEKVSFSLRG